METKIIYTITILVHSEMEAGRNPEFQFDNREKALNFMETCFDNFYHIEVNRQQMEVE